MGLAPPGRVQTFTHKLNLELRNFSILMQLLKVSSHFEPTFHFCSEKLRPRPTSTPSTGSPRGFPDKENVTPVFDHIAASAANQ